jgi:hypothetical protein
MPVPIVTENHDGEKFLTILRQPTSYFVWFADVTVFWELLLGVRGGFVLEEAFCRFVGAHCAAGIVNAGLSDAIRSSS